MKKDASKTDCKALLKNMNNREKNTKNRLKSILAWTGWVGFSACITLLCVTSCSQNNMMNQQSIQYHEAKKSALKKSAILSDTDAKSAVDKLTKFLQNIDSTEYVKNEIDNVYAKDAYLNDTLKSLNNRDEIEEHFLKMADVMTTYSVEAEDVAKSSEGYYIRWTMRFSAPKLAKGKEIESIGISHVIFDSEGKVLIHQDFWDSTSGMFEHLPILGGGIRLVKKRL